MSRNLETPMGNKNTVQSSFILTNIDQMSDYMEYTSISDILLNHYKDMNSFGMEKNKIQIENWLQQTPLKNQNVPLIIKSQKNESLKLFIVNWMFSHLKNSRKEYKDVIIPNFVNYTTKESSQFYIIYNIITKLKEIFNIKQNIDPSEEKLRLNFEYWLDLISRKIKKNTFFDADLIIVIEGAHLISDIEKQQENNMQFWLPRNLPERVRMIITLEENSYNFEYFQRINCRILEIESDQHSAIKIMNLYKKRKFLPHDNYVNTMFKVLNQLVKKLPVNNFFVEVFISCFIPYLNANVGHFDKTVNEIITTIYENEVKIKNLIAQLEKIKSFKDLIELIIEFYSESFTSKKNFETILGILCISYKGVTLKEIQNISNIGMKSLRALCIIMKVFFVFYRKYWKITNPTFIKVFNSKYLSIKQSKKTLYLKITNELEIQQDSIRKLEEQTNNLYSADEYFSLKQKISQIDNFILLYNQQTKFDLFKFWKKLEEKGYDPVHEYNKAYELFEMHYNPKDSDIFMINVQLSRFFKELSEFESALTPEFRHPFIQGKIVQNVNTIGLKQTQQESFGEKEFTQKVVINFKSFSNVANIQKSIFSDYYQEYPKIFDSHDEDTDQLYIKKRYATNDNSIIDYLEQIGILQELEQIKICGRTNNILKKHESMNIDIPLNKEKFLNYFSGILQEKKKYQLKSKNVKSEYDFDIQDNLESKQIYDSLLLMKEKKNESDLIQKMICNIDLTIAPTKPKRFYYYKRWIWMNFPLICLSKQKNNFSEIISYCYSESQSFLNFEQDRNIYLKSLSIIHNLKKKKNQIFDNTLPQNGKKLPYIYLSKNSIDPGLNYLMGTKKKSTKKLKLKHSTTMKKKLIGNYDRRSTFNGKIAIAAFKKKQQQKFNLPKIKKSQSIIQPIFEHKIYQSKFAKRQTVQKKKVSQMILQHSKYPLFLSEVLQKSKFQEEILLKQNMIELQNTVFADLKINQDMNAFQLKNDMLNSVLEKYNQKKIVILQIKKSEIIKAYNQIIYEIEKLRKQIQNLENKKINVEEKKKLSQEDNVKKLEKQFKQQQEDYKKKIEKMTQNYFFVINQKKRYQAIIDICLINQINNEDWIRNLNYYLNNLKKVCKETETKIMNKKRYRRQVQNQCKEFYSSYQLNKKKREIMVNSFKNYLIKKKNLDLKVFETDKKILQEVFKENKKESQTPNKEFLKIKKNMKRHNKSIQLIMTNRMDEFRKFYVKLEPLFEHDLSTISNNETNLDEILKGYNKEWYKSPFFQQVMFKVHRRRSLDVNQKDKYFGVETKNQ